jgi:cytidylate kinase
VPADDAIVIDSTSMSEEDVLAKVEELAREKQRPGNRGQGVP